MQAEFIESGALRRVIAVYRAKHRLQPCEPKPRPAEARRIYKSPFLTGLAPLASAREHLPYLCQNRTRLRFIRRRELPKQLFLINPPAPLRCQRTAESTTSLTKSRNPCHSGCEVAGSEDSAKREKNKQKATRE